MSRQKTKAACGRGSGGGGGANKQRYLAWRGYNNAAGQGVDDNGVVINIGNNEGDIRPTPVLLPAF